MFLCCKAGCDAKVVNNVLVVSFLDADQPKVWRADMTHVATAAFEVQEMQGKFRLVMKGAGGAEEITSFSDRAKAVRALRKMTDAMLSGGASATSGVLRKVLKTALWLVGIFLVLFFIASLMSGPRTAGTDAPVVKTGVPMPADEMFR